MPVQASISITFEDENYNPIPPETLVTICPIDSAPQTASVIASGYVGASSSIVATLTIRNSYRVQYFGNRGPYGCSFFYLETDDPIAITCPGYRSPSKTQEGYILERTALHPKRWAGDDALASGNAFTLMSGLAALNQWLDYQLRLVTASQRLLSCTQGAIDSWAQDFFGGNLPRYTGEPDGAYILRIEQNLNPQIVTLNAIAAQARAYLVLQATYNVDQLFALDTSGALDLFGGLDNAGTLQVIPNVTAFDRQSDPATSAIVGLEPGDICLLFSYPGITSQGFFLGQSYLGQNTYLLSTAIQVVSAPTEALDQYLNYNVKAFGTRIIYADNRTA